MPRASKVKDGLKPPTSLPAGTVTFLFTDIEGSTQRWEAHRVEMARAVARHDELVRTEVEKHGGFVFKTVGDAFCVAFPQVQDAVASAIDAQRALSAEDFGSVNALRVRMAIHSGSVQEREADYFGPTVNRVARLLAVGHGGQVLISATANDLLLGSLPAQTGLRDLGTHQLRDLAFPEHVYQPVAAGLPETFPTLRSLTALPKHCHSFYGLLRVESVQKHSGRSHRHTGRCHRIDHRSRHHDERTHHLVIFVFENVAMVHVPAGVTVEACGDGDQFAWVDAHGVLETHLVGIERAVAFEGDG
jgi:class 3 adenylate cyclase